MVSRLTALRLLRRFGVYLTGPKQDAVMRGDTSNTIVHPFFIFAIASFGTYIRVDGGNSPVMVRLLAKNTQGIFEQLTEVNKRGDPYAKAHVFLHLATYCLRNRWLKITRKYITKACTALNAAMLRFIPATGRPPRLTDDVYERLVTLSQIIYLENYMFLAVDGMEPTMTARIEREFRNELQVRARSFTSRGVD